MSFKFDNFPHSCKYDLPPTRIIKTIHLVSFIIYSTWMSFLYLFYLNHFHIFHIFYTLICKIDMNSIKIIDLNKIIKTSVNGNGNIINHIIH
jgi:hypothetical protein